jgi:hypothetical protein
VSLECYVTEELKGETQMGGYGRTELGSIGGGDSTRVSLAPEGVRRIPIDWRTVPKNESGDRCLRYGTILIPLAEKDERGLLVGPYDPNTSDGRQRVSRSQAFILNQTVCESEQGDAPVEMFESGTVYKPHLLVGGENQPSWDDFNMAFTGIRFLSD